MRFFLTILLFFTHFFSFGQDSALKKHGTVYIKQAKGKVEQYSKKLTDKTEQTIDKLARWENKIRKLVEKGDPEVATRLFGNGQPTFASLSQRIKEGKSLAENYTAKYDAYTDRLESSVKYLEKTTDTTGLTKLKSTGKALTAFDTLSESVANSEYLKEFIEDRKKMLIAEAGKYLGKTKYLSKINKEGYYYVDAISNYKEVFHDSKKTEELVIKALEQLPAFREFAASNSPLAGLFSSPASFPSPGASVPIVNGLTPRSGIQQFVSSTMPALDPAAAMQQVQQIQQKASELSTGLDEATKKEKGQKDFVPNSQRNKPFFKRLEFTTDLQFGKKVSFLPVTATIGGNVGYRLNDRSSIGVGASYFLGLGNGWRHINFTNEGVGLRAYVRWMLSRGWDMQGESDWNYMSSFRNINELKNLNPWQRNALLGIGKNYKINKKIKGSVRLFYDFMNRKNSPPTQPFVFRFGYGL